MDTVELGKIVRKVQKKKTFKIKVGVIDVYVRFTGFKIKERKYQSTLCANIEVIDYYKCANYYNEMVFRRDLKYNFNLYNLSDARIFLKLFGINNIELGTIKKNETKR